MAEASKIKSSIYFKLTMLLNIQLSRYPGITPNERYMGTNKAGKSYSGQTFQLFVAASGAQLGTSARWSWQFWEYSKFQLWTNYLKI